MLEQDEIIASIREAGVVGAGGGGFPTCAKLSAKADVLIANGAECEALCYCDQVLMALHARDVLDGLLLAARAVSAKRIILALKGKYEAQVEGFKKFLASAPYDRIELLQLPDVYPVGDEFVLTFEATGRVIPQGGLPIDVGVIVHNVATLHNIARASRGLPVTERMVSVCGEAPRPAVYMVPIGTSFDDLLRACGLTSSKGLSVLDGGVMMGNLVDPGRAWVKKTTSAIVVLSSDSRAIMERSSSLNRVFKISMSVCDQCTFCTELCPRYLLGHNIRPHLIMRRSGFTRALGDGVLAESHFCSECGICSLYSCPLEISPRRVNVFLKQEYPRPRQDGGSTQPRPEYHDRRLPSSRLKARLGVLHLDGPPPTFAGQLEVSKLKVAMQQHVGEAACPIVVVGERVKKGQLIASINKGQLGAPIHAPIDAVVIEVSADIITLER
ncbi:SLBB domain-containing protein [bacterium]|nr:SLBB domain-containing protein [bacterium]